MADKPEESKIKNLTPITNAKIDATKIRKSTGRQFLDSFITRDFSLVRDYLFNDILVPAIKDTIVDSICSAVNMIFKGSPGKGGSSYTRKWNSQGSSINYGTIYRSTDPGYFRKEEKSYESPISRRNTMDYMDIPFPDRVTAETILDDMREVLEHYPCVSISEYYEIIRQRTGGQFNLDDGRNWTLADFGWTDLSDVIVTWSHGAWIIALPKAVPIK